MALKLALDSSVASQHEREQAERVFEKSKTSIRGRNSESRSQEARELLNSGFWLLTSALSKCSGLNG
jgi:hypothetical protein